MNFHYGIHVELGADPRGYVENWFGIRVDSIMEFLFWRTWEVYTKKIQVYTGKPVMFPRVTHGFTWWTHVEIMKIHHGTTCIKYA